MNPIIASNSSSSLLSTISSSSAVMSNPYVYSQTGNVDEFTSTQWIKTSPQSFNQGTQNQTLHFDIAKMGLVGRAVLEIPWVLKTDGDSTGILCPCFPTQAIQEVTLTSQGRVISRLDRSSLIARLSERPPYVAKGMNTALKLTKTAQSLATTGITATTGTSSYLSLDFAFNSDQYSLDTLFLQSVRISVTIGNLGSLVRAASGHAFKDDLQYSSPHVYIQYKNQNQQASDALVSANYSSGLLSQILPTNVSETVKYTSMDATEGEETTFTAELKETSCVENLYVFLMMDPDATANSAGWSEEDCTPLHVTGNITFASNGQNWFDMPAELIGTFGYENQKGRNAYDYCPTMDSANSGGNPIVAVYCINFGQGGLCSNTVSGLVSMRELSNPTVSVTTKATANTKGKKVGLHVAYNTRQLSTVVSSSGMINIALSN